MTSLYTDSVTSIYNSVIDEKIYKDSLQKSSLYVGSKSATLVVVQDTDLRLQQISEHSESFNQKEESALQFFIDNLFEFEREAWNTVRQLPPQTVIRDTELWPDVNLLERPDIIYLKKHFGIYRKVAAHLSDIKSWADCIAFQFDDTLIDIPEKAIRNIKELLPHYAKSIELGRVFRELKFKHNACLGALNHIGFGVCVTLQNGLIVTLNAECEAIIESNPEIYVDQFGRISAKNHALKNTLLSNIEQASLTAAGIGNNAEFCLSVSRKASPNPMMIEICPIRDYANELDNSLAGVLIFFIDPDRTPKVNIKLLASAYGLTLAETEVCDLAMKGYTNDNISEIRSVSITTTRSQMKNILKKTNCQRKLDLLSLAFKLSPPILP